MKILYIDIETAPNVGFTWGMYEQNVIEFISEWYILTFAYKWEHENKVHVKTLADYKPFKKDIRNDIELVRDLYLLLDEADAVVAYNGKKFDIKKIQSRLFAHGIKPPSPFRIIDPLTVVRNKFGFNSNKLEAIAQLIKVNGKIHHEGFPLWRKCYNGDLKAFEMMAKYNKGDIMPMVHVYKEILPWIDNHPNHNIYNETKENCPNCGSDKMEKRGMQHGKQRYQCKSCYKWCNSGTIKGIKFR